VLLRSTPKLKPGACAPGKTHTCCGADRLELVLRFGFRQKDTYA